MNLFKSKEIRSSEEKKFILREIQKSDFNAMHSLLVKIQTIGVGNVITQEEFDKDKSAWEQKLYNWIDKPQGLWIVAESHGQILGEAKLKVFPIKRLSHSGIFSIGVHPDFQSQGIGTALTLSTIEWAEKQGLTRIELYVLNNNPKALGLYQKCGFIKEGIRKNFLRMEDGSYVDDQIMAWLAKN